MKLLLDFFQNPAAIWNATLDDLKESELPPAQIDSFLEYRKKFPDAPEKMFEHCHARNIHLITIRDEIYPESLRQIKNPPTILFYYGTLDPYAKRIAMVGTRRVSSYGRRVANELAEFLARAGFTIVSGAAAGIDTSSHWGALKTGRTVAVLGCGIDIAYPKENRELLQRISERGAVISEYSPTTQPNTGFFPARNRIVSGLSLGTIVVEASETSGAIITADLARQQGRDVFAIPGDVDAESMRGCHRLAQRGAILIAKPQDVVDYYAGKLKFEGDVKISRRIDQPSKTSIKISTEDREILDQLKTEINPPKPIQLFETERKILNALSSEPISVDEIINQTQIPVGKIMQNLLTLENSGLILKDDLDRYSKIGVDQPKSIQISETEQKILDALSSEPRSVDEIINRTQIPVGKIMQNLLKLENSGLILKDDLDRYTRI